MTTNGAGDGQLDDVRSAKADCEEKTLRPALERHGERDAAFATSIGPVLTGEATVLLDELR